MTTETGQLAWMRKLIMLVAVLTLAVAGTALAAKPKARATSGTAWVGVSHQSGGFSYISGDVKDKVFGRAAISYKTKINASTSGIRVVSPEVVLFTSKGSFVGTGSGDVKVNSDGSQTVSNGVVTFKRGTGQLKGHTGSLKFGGKYDPKTGIYTFKYKGTYR